MISMANALVTYLRFRLAQTEKGQALAEYGLILGLIAVFCIIALGVLGVAISGNLNDVAGAIGIDVGGGGGDGGGGGGGE